jgi:hypothetical protein
LHILDCSHNFSSMKYMLLFSQILYSLNMWSTVINFYEFTADTVPACHMKCFSLHIACASLLPSPFFLSFLPCLSLFVPCHWRKAECRLQSHKISVLLAIQNSVSVGYGWGVMFLVPSFWEKRTRATQVPSWGRKHTYGRTQNLYILHCFVVQHKICTYYNILHIIFIFSTPGLVNYII